VTARPRIFDIVVPDCKPRVRLDVFLTVHVENATRSKVQQAIRDGHVTVDGKPVKPSHLVSCGEVIHVEIPKPAASVGVEAEEIPLEILFEDDHLLVVNKPAGMVTHPAYGNYTGTLVNALLYYCRDRLSSGGDPARPGIVHRLDKDTSGLMVIAKNDQAHAHLAKQFSRRTISREYWAIAWGRFTQGGRKTREDLSGTIDAALGRSKSDRKKIAVSEAGKASVTEYQVLEEFEYLSLLKLKLRTGRTHQIRVHLHHIGHPVFGDPTYGGRRIAWGGISKKKTEEVHRMLKIINRQALHAKTIGFAHPVTGEILRFDSELPPDMHEVLGLLHSSS